MTYAFTGCSGAITTNASVSVDWGELPRLGGISLTAPIVHGPFQLVPAGWTGVTKPLGPRFPARPTIPSAETTSLAEARTFPHWREPDLPEGWAFTYAESGDEAEVGYFRAYYDGLTLSVSASGITAKYSPEESSATYNNNGSQTSVRETLQIAGRPARIHRSITAEQFPTTLYVWDEATSVLYLLAWNGNAAKLITLAESMFDDTPLAAPPSESITLTYDTYDTTGAVSEAGSYAFLRDTKDLSSTADTHGALSVVTGIIVNVADDAGTPRATFYDGIKVGDVVEWVPTADEKCWQRYRVTAILEDPAGSSSRRLFALDHLPEPVIECDGRLVGDGRHTRNGASVESSRCAPRSRRHPGHAP